MISPAVGPKLSHRESGGYVSRQLNTLKGLPTFHPTLAFSGERSESAATPSQVLAASWQVVER